MLAQTLEIKVALLGNVSAGKTTVLNAIFRDKFGEVAIKRTTVGANFFRVHQKENSITVVSASETELANGREWLKVTDNPSSAESIFKEICKDNVQLREINSDVVHEKYFDIELSEEILPMGQKCKLVFVDIPGINEAGTDCKYKDYVTEHWHNFDCVVVVMDGKHDVRTNDQMYLLNLVKENLQKRNIPVIVLCNKIDYISEEQDELIRIAKEEITKIFHSSSLDETTQKILENDGSKIDYHSIASLSPAFIPISAIQGYIYRTAALMTLERFRSFDMAFIEDFGRELVGRAKWRKLSNEQKINHVFEIVNDMEQREQGLKESNFDTFLRSLYFFIGGEDTQKEIAKQQVNIAIEALKNDSTRSGMTRLVKQAYEKLRLIEGNDIISSPSDIHDAFWLAYGRLENSTFDMFESKWRDHKVYKLSPVMDELISYYDFCTEAHWLDEKNNTVKRMKSMIRRYIGVVLQQEQLDMLKCVDRTWFEQSDALSPYDWDLIKGSICLLSHNRFYIQSFGKETLLMKAQGSNWNVPKTFASFSNCRFCGSALNSTQQCGSCKIHFGKNPVNTHCLNCNIELKGSRYCSSCEYRSEYYTWELNHAYDPSKARFQPINSDHYYQCVHVTIPSTPADPNHFGHLIWKYCEFQREIYSIKKKMIGDIRIEDILISNANDLCLLEVVMN